MLSYGSVIESHKHIEMTCCKNTKTDDDSTKEKSDNHCPPKQCPSKDCNFQFNTFQVFCFDNLAELEIPKEFFEESTNDYYLSLLIKDLTHTIWHPPKNIT